MHQQSEQKPQLLLKVSIPILKIILLARLPSKLVAKKNGGSGVIIARQNNTYLILTNNHVLRGGNAFTINTHDAVTYQAKAVSNGIDTDDDLALLQFSSDKDYQTATINTAATPKAEQAIIAAGYSAETGELVTEEGKIERVPDKTLKDGYEIGYSSNIVQGMSGGAILNVDGEVIGINGKSAFPIVNTGYTYQDGTKPTPAEIEQLRQLSWGLSINRLLTQLNPELITAYGLPIPESTAVIVTPTPTPTGWIRDLEAKAKQITVRIDSSSRANGSGVIIAKEGNTYTVLTANHVLCEKDNANKCIDYAYEIVAPDGEKYSVDASTINRQEGVDLAVVRFTSNENYQIAELANYPLTDNDAVFVAGYPQLSNSTAAQWRFSLGLGLDREQGLSNIVDSSLSTDSSGLTNSQGSLSGGYEMVYTSITYGGMSGGAVLDKDGRVIGIHGLAEGETALDSQGSSQKQIQLGYSLGIPINTFIGLANRLKINSTLPIQDNRPREPNRPETEAFEAAVLGADIPQGNATAENWLERGNQLWRLDRNDEAVQAFDRAIALQPEFIHLAYYGKGLALFGNEDEAALASLELATETEPNFAPAFLTKSSVLRGLNRLNEALTAIETTISLHKDNANLYSEKGFILLKLKRYSEAEVAYNRAIQLNPRTAFYYNRGNLYDEQGEVELAIADYNQAIEINPEIAEAYINRGLLYNEQGKVELAIADYNQAIEINPQFAEVYNNRGLLYVEQGEVELAIADYSQAIEINPQFAEAYINRGNLYDEQGEVELAIADYSQALKINPQSALAYYNRGRLYQEQGEIELAIADYNQAIEINPQFAEAYYNRGRLYQEQREIELAIADYSQALKINPQFADAYSNRGVLYDEQREVELAFADFSQAIKINPQLADAYINRGNLYQEQREVELAIADYSQALKINPQSALAYYNRGVLYREQGEVELAFADFNQVLKINPEYAKAYVNLGLLYVEMEDIQTARQNFQKAQQLSIAQNNTADAEAMSYLLEALKQIQTEAAANTSQNESIPNIAQFYFDRALNQQKNNEVESAIDNYSAAIGTAIGIDPNHEKAYYNRGVLYQKQGEVELALADYNQALQINPEFANAYYNRGRLYQEQGEVELALADYNQAIEINPEFANAYYNRGRLYQEQGEVELAFADYNQAIEINPKYAPAYGNRGRLYQEQEKVELAFADYNQAIEINPKYAPAYGNRGRLYQEQMGNIKSARQDFQKSQQLYTSQDNTAGAELMSDWLKALEQTPTETVSNTSQNESISNNAQAYFDRALEQQKNNEVTSAIDNYSQAIEIDRNHEKALINRGLLYASKREDELAIEDYNRAISINPNNSTAYRNRGVIYFEQEKYEFAEADWNQAIKVNPQDALVYYNRGLLHQELGNYPLAETDLEKAEELAVIQGKTALAEKVAKVLSQLQ